ncbi:MAG: 1,4-alpha-glucan branching enzyme, partial [Verrucomicrobiota bacterium]
MKPLTDPEDVSAILEARHEDPFSVLGVHRSSFQGDGGWVIRICRPDAMKVWVVRQDTGEEIALNREHSQGFFDGFLAGGEYPPPYALKWEDAEGKFHGMEADPYSFGPILGDQDMYYLGEGSHRRLYRCLGANRRVVGGQAGILFAVWAPNARRASVVGDFNQWDGRIHPMRKRIEAGVWEVFIPGLGFGEHYKFELVGNDGSLISKS